MRKENSGLGLAIVRLISEKLGDSAIAAIENEQLTIYIRQANNVELKKEAGKYYKNHF